MCVRCVMVIKFCCTFLHWCMFTVAWMYYETVWIIEVVGAAVVACDAAAWVARCPYLK